MKRRAAFGGASYLDTGGTGSALIFLHGTGCEASDWEPVIERLPPSVRCVALDFRGHGKSAVPTAPFALADLAEDALRLADLLGIEEFVLAGHSLGGMAATAAARRSKRLRGLALFEGWTRLGAGGSAFDEGRFYGSLPKRAVAEIQRKSQETRRRFQPEIWRRFWNSVEAFDGYDILQSAEMPVLEAYGGMGRNASTREKLRVPPNPHIRWQWISGAGHYLPHERPAEVAEAAASVWRAAFG